MFCLLRLHFRNTYPPETATGLLGERGTAAGIDWSFSKYGIVFEMGAHGRAISPSLEEGERRSPLCSTRHLINLFLNVYDVVLEKEAKH